MYRAMGTYLQTWARGALVWGGAGQKTCCRNRSQVPTRVVLGGEVLSGGASHTHAHTHTGRRATSERVEVGETERGGQSGIGRPGLRNRRFSRLGDGTRSWVNKRVGARNR